MKQTINFLFVGVGGQGILTASDITAAVGLQAGFDAKKSEVHGFSQRGGLRNPVWLLESKSVHLSKVALKIPGLANTLSITRRLSRFLYN